jgi:hypothetical protein
MLETVLTKAILRHAERYIKNLPTVRVSLWGGDIVFKKLELKLDVLQETFSVPPDFK